MRFLEPGAGPTNYGKWTREEPGDMYNTEWFPGFEPIVLAYREGLPYYREDFRGPWYSRIAWTEEAVRIGFKIGILRHVFVFRTDRTSQPKPEPFANEALSQFRRYVKFVNDYSPAVDTVRDFFSKTFTSCPEASTVDGTEMLLIQQRILCEWKNFTESEKLRRQIVSVIYPHQYEIKDWDITLATQGSVDRLGRLLDGTKRWNGPISAAIYIHQEASIAEFINFFQENRNALNGTSFHLFFEKISTPKDNEYPHNYLRNLAMSNIQTNYVINIDMDFVVNANAHDDLVELIKTDNNVRRHLDNRTVLVLPAFENTFHLDEEDVSLAPPTKAEVIEQVKVLKTAEAFHLKKYQPGHGPTNFERWYANKTQAIYDIDYEVGFEPYLLARKDGLPLFWTGFRGFGFNKKSWVEEVHRMGYKFAVLRDHFVFHVGQSSTEISPKSWVKREYKFVFLPYLDKEYTK